MEPNIVAMILQTNGAFAIGTTGIDEFFPTGKFTVGNHFFSIRCPKVVFQNQFLILIMQYSSFKFVGNENWGDGLFAQTAEANPFDESQQGATIEGDGDRKWMLPSTTQGTYTLELNLHTMKINFFKVD